MNLLDITHMCQGVCARLHPRDLTAHETPKHSYDFTCAADRSSLSSGLWSFCKRKDRMRLLQRQTVVNTSCRMYNDGKTHSGSERLVISTAILVSGNFPDCFLDTLTSVQTIWSSDFGHVHMSHHTQFDCFPPLVWIIKATWGPTFYGWKCEGISSVGDGHPRGPAVTLSCKQEEGWLRVSSHKRGGNSPHIILLKSSSRGRGDTETGSIWTIYPLCLCLRTLGPQYP